MVKRILGILLLVVSSLWAQAQPTSLGPVYNDVFPIPVGLSATYTGTPGQTPFYYWVIGVYNTRNSAPSTPVGPITVNTTGGGSVNISWQGTNAGDTQYVISYTVLRTLSNTFPSAGSCTSCLVGSGITTTSTTDTLGALSNFTLATTSRTSSTIILDTLSTGFTRLYDLRNNGSKFPMEIIRGTVLPTFCNEGDPFYVLGSAVSTTSGLYMCGAVNDWTLTGSGGGATIAHTLLPLKGDNTGNAIAAGSSDIIALFTACSGVQYLGADGACHAAGASSGSYEYIRYTAGKAQGPSAGIAWSYPSTNAPTPLRAADTASPPSGSVIYAVAEFTATGQSVQDQFFLPSEQTGAIDIGGTFRSAGITGNVVFAIQTGCVATSALLDPTFNTKDSITTAALGTAYWMNTFSMTTINITGCGPSKQFFWTFVLDAATTTTGNVDLVSLWFKVRRSS